MQRAVVVTTDPALLPERTTWYLVTNLPAPGTARAHAEGALPAADLAEMVRLYGLRNWVEQSYKQTKHALGWSQYQVRADIAIRRHWQLVCCAFSFCWYHQCHAAGETVQMVDGAEAPAHCSSPTTDEMAGRKKISAIPGDRPRVSWPVALRQVRSWLEPWIMLWRYWRAWSTQPPPPALQQLLDWLWQGRGISLYESA